jgi:O-antigen/teichoic acid export membrane protein
MKRYLARYKYIAVTILSSLVTFLKSYFFMDLLSKEELGYIALFQSMILIVTFFQMGVIYGGYRLISFSILRQKKANNTVITYLFILIVFFLISFFIVNYFIPINWFWTAGLVVGLLSLWANWVSNMHIALDRTDKLSLIILASILLSFAGIPFLNTYPTFGAVALLGLQPFFIILFSYIFNKDFGFKIDFKNTLYFKLVIKLGFIPFLTGVLHYINLQIERWVIGFDLGIKALGDYYLVFLYVSLFSVIPGAIASLNFPEYMKVLSLNNSEKSLVEIFKVHYLEIIFYMLIVSFGTFFIMPWCIKMLLPMHISGIKYVKIVFVGLFFFTLVDPISFIINAKLHYKELLYIYIGSLVVSAISYCFLYFNNFGSLVNYSFVNVIFYISVSLGYVVYFFRKGATGYLGKKNISNV